MFVCKADLDARFPGLIDSIVSADANGRLTRSQRDQKRRG